MHYDGVACREAVVAVREATCTATQKSGSKERREQRQETAGKADWAVGK